MVEFGLSIAAVAFVALLGFSALGHAQAAYWGGPVQAALAQPTPTTTDFVHPTSVDAPVCFDGTTALPTNVAIGDTITCNAPTVRDIYLPAAERHPAWGYIGLHLNGDPNPVASTVCALPRAVSGATNTCSTTLSWQVTDKSLANTNRQLSLWYECASSPCPYAPASNHTPSQSSAVAVSFVPKLQIVSAGTQCVNPLTGGTPVEIGHPLICTAQIQNLTNPAQLSGQTLTWQTSAAGAGQPQPTLGCVTNPPGTPNYQANLPSMLWNNPPPAVSCAPGPVLQCVTDNSGQCQVVYRRLRALINNATLPSSDTLTVTAPVNVAKALTVYVVDPGQETTPPSSNAKHPTVVSVTCTGPGVSSGSFNVRRASFVETTAVGPGAHTCAAVVLDTDPSPIFDCNSVAQTCSNPPEVMDAHPPLGSVNFNWPGKQVGDLDTCWLTRIDNYTGQLPNQAPFAASCSLTFSISSPVPSNSTVDVHFTGPAQADSTFSVNVH